MDGRHEARILLLGPLQSLLHDVLVPLLGPKSSQCINQRDREQCAQVWACRHHGKERSCS